MLALAWTMIQFSLTMPILNHLTGQRQNLNHFCRAPGEPRHAADLPRPHLDASRSR
jgi:hypothetical protein